MVDGALVSDSFRAAEVHDALNLCLACKGCASDCPTGVDMATYRAEVLHQRYRRRVRPRSHYTLGWLPRWARLAGLAPRLVNRLLAIGSVGSLAKRLLAWTGVARARCLLLCGLCGLRHPHHPRSEGISIGTRTALNQAVRCIQVKNADTSTAMLTDKMSHVLASGVEVCAASDSSCLMHISGGLSRLRTHVLTVHLAEILATTEAPA